MKSTMGLVCLGIGLAIAASAEVRTLEAAAKSVHPVRSAVKNKATTQRMAVQNNGISYHGGPIMLGGTIVYYIWYGNWTGNNAPTLLSHLVNAIGKNAYYGINTTYTNSWGGRVMRAVQMGMQTTDNYSQGTELTDAAVQAIVTSAITSGRLPKDPHGVYFVLASQDVKETSGFCTLYCGWHTYANIGGTNIKYSFVGDPSRCMDACAFQPTSPNGNPGADAMASTLIHELVAAVTNPELNGWYDAQGQENSDKCAWTYGIMAMASNGSFYNLSLDGRQYLIQQNWVNANGGYCAKRY